MKARWNVSTPDNAAPRPHLSSRQFETADDNNEPKRRCHRRSSHRALERRPEAHDHHPQKPGPAHVDRSRHCRPGRLQRGGSQHGR